MRARGSQAFAAAYLGATAFNQDIGAWNTAAMTEMRYVCVLCDCLRARHVPWLEVRRCVASVPSATADRARGHACLLACFTHFSSNMSALVTTQRPSPACPHPASAVAPNLERLHLAPHALGRLGAACTMHWTGRRGSGLMRRVLFERAARLGSQAFCGAKTFNQNIGSWNTAKLASMSYVCALCHRLCVGRVRLGLGCGAA